MSAEYAKLASNFSAAMSAPDPLRTWDTQLVIGTSPLTNPKRAAWLPTRFRSCTIASANPSRPNRSGVLSGDEQIHEQVDLFWLPAAQSRVHNWNCGSNSRSSCCSVP